MILSSSYTFNPLSYPGALLTHGDDINYSGQVVGYFLDENNYEHAFFYDGENYTIIDPSFAGLNYGFVAAAYSISNDGHVLGNAYDPATNNYDYFVYDSINHSYTILNDPTGGSFTWTREISNAGVTGYYWNGSKDVGFSWNWNGTYVTIDIPGTVAVIPTSINDSGQVVGYGEWDDSTGQVSYHGFLDVGGVITLVDDPNAATSFPINNYEYPPPIGTVAQFINNDGLIAGYYSDANGTQICFLDDHGKFFDIVDPLALPGLTIINGISDAGVVFGSYVDADQSGGYITNVGHEHGFVWTEDNGFITVDDPNLLSSMVTAMSVSGQMLVNSNVYQANTEIGTPIVDPTVVADHDHVNLYQTVVENAANGVLANDTDPIPIDALSVSAVNGSVTNVGMPVQGLYGALTLAADGSYSYTATHALPDDGVGFDTFSYTAATGAGGQATTDLTIVVVGSDKHYLGGIPNATINGGAYNFNGQVLDGSLGNDILIAGSSATVEIGGPGDTLTGSTMADKFVFHGDDFGHNEITNFNVKMDTIWFDSTEFTSYQQVLANATQVGTGKNATTIIDDGTGDVIQLDGVKLWTLTANDFHFA